MNALDSFIQISNEEFQKVVATIDKESIQKAADLILEAKKAGNRLHITGIGKPGHVSTYTASLFSSTGTPTYYLHGTEAVHGSCGQLTAGDVVIAISNSGETSELKATVLAVKNNGCKVIGVSGGSESWLAKNTDAFLFAGVKAEGGPMNRAPRNSITAESFIIQMLSALLQDEKALTPQEYVLRHPGGALGQLREGEK
jgi:arabinose-5-phosphate isomerase